MIDGVTALIRDFITKKVTDSDSCLYSRLTMPHDERMLKTAYKTYGKNSGAGNFTAGQSMRGRGQGNSQTPL